MKEINNNQRYSSIKSKSNKGSIKYFHNHCSSYHTKPKLDAFIKKLTIEAKVKKDEVEKFIKILLQN